MYHLTRSLLLTLFLTGLSNNLKADIVFTSGQPNQGDGLDMSEFVVAQEFLLPSATTTLTAATFFSSADVDPFTSQFSGAVGWAIFGDNGGPGNVVASGIDTTPTLIDTGAIILGTGEWALGFTIPNLKLSGGPYWLGLHESAFGTPDDGSSIYWDTTAAQTASPAMVTADLSGAGGWIPGDGSALALQLIGSDAATLPPSPEPRMLLPLGLLLCLTMLIRSKRNSFWVDRRIGEGRAQLLTVELDASQPANPGELFK